MKPQKKIKLKKTKPTCTLVWFCILCSKSDRLLTDQQLAFVFMKSFPKIHLNLLVSIGQEEFTDIWSTRMMHKIHWTYSNVQ